jgi:hypothetical protein
MSRRYRMGCVAKRSSALSPANLSTKALPGSPVEKAIRHEGAQFLVFRAGFGNVRAVRVARVRMGFLVALFLCLAAPASFAQDSQTPARTDPSASGPPKAHAKKIVHKNGKPAPSAAQPASEEAEKAAHVAEARKKFFEQSDGFDNGDSGRVFLGGGNGLSPGAGFKF